MRIAHVQGKPNQEPLNGDALTVNLYDEFTWDRVKALVSSLYPDSTVDNGGK